jgi:transposase-like protein
LQNRPCLRGIDDDELLGHAKQLNVSRSASLRRRPPCGAAWRVINGRIEVITGPERWRRWSHKEKLELLAKACCPGNSVSQIARGRGTSASQIRLVSPDAGKGAHHRQLIRGKRCPGPDDSFIRRIQGQDRALEFGEQKARKAGRKTRGAESRSPLERDVLSRPPRSSGVKVEGSSHHADPAWNQALIWQYSRVGLLQTDRL